MTSNRFANDLNSHSGIWCHPEGVELHMREETANVTKHICPKVVYRGDKTMENKSVLTVNTGLEFAWAGK